MKELLELEEQGMLNEDEKKTARRLLIKQVSDTDEMLRKILRWSQAQLDGILTKRIPTHLYEIIKDEVDHLNYQKTSKKISIDFSLINEDIRIMVDPQHLRIILQNCLQNSIKFSNPNSQIKLWNSENPEDGLINLHIKDEGIGIPKNKLKEIFSNLVQIKSTEGTHKEKGTGLGLLLVRQFTEKNKGKFDIQSIPNEGTEIILSFEKINVPVEKIES